MAEGLFFHPELLPLVLSNVHLTGKIIGYGAHGSVREVTVAVHAQLPSLHPVTPTSGLQFKSLEGCSLSLFVSLCSSSVSVGDRRSPFWH